MTEENELTATQIRVESTTEGLAIADSDTLRLVVEGDSEVVIATAEIVVVFLQEAFGAEIATVQDGKGNDLSFGPAVIDPLATGDDSVEA